MTNGTSTSGKTSGLAIAALVLSILICFPLFPLVGLILGIVAMVKINSNPNLGGKGLAIAAIIVGGVGIFISFGVTAAVAIPAFISYIRSAKQAEVDGRLHEIARSAQSYYGAEHMTATGAALPPQFPASTPVTPERSCAENADGRCQPDPAAWQNPTWQALNFSISEPHYYRYQFVSEGTAFTARALGDLDNDGIFSTFELTGQGTPDGRVTISPGIFENLPTE